MRFKGMLAPNGGAGAQRRAACGGCAGPGTRYRRPFRRTRARRAGAHGLGAPTQARLRDRPGTLPAVWRQLQDHRHHRGAGGDGEDPQPPGPARQGPAARAGAAAGAFSGGLIPEGVNGSATALRVAYGPRLHAWGQRASRSGNSGRFRGRIAIERGESSPQTACLTASRDGDSVADRRKRGFEIPTPPRDLPLFGLVIRSRMAEKVV